MLEPGSHGARDLAPALPDIEQLVELAALGQDVRHLAQAEALALEPGRTVLTLAVGRVQERGDPRQLCPPVRILGRRQAEAELDQLELASELFGQLQLVELDHLGHGLGHIGHHLLVCFGGDDLGVVCDVGHLDPVGALPVDP